MIWRIVVGGIPSRCQLHPEPIRIELRHLAQRGKIRSYSDSTVTVIPRLESDIRSKTDIGGSCKAAYRDPMSAVWVSF